MGGIVDGGAGIGIKTSPRQEAIEKAQAELRHEYDVRDKRRRELEFLEKGGNPLDFKLGNAASVSVQSTSLVDRHKEQYLPGDAKVNLALTASTHGDSIESSGRLGVTTACEHNSADSHLRFDGGAEVPEGDEKSVRLDRKNSVVHPDQSVKTDSNRSTKESEDSAIFRPYARRNRSRLNRDSGRPSSTDLLYSHTSHGTSLPTRSLIKDSRVLTLDSSDRKEPNPFSVSQARLPDNNDGLLSKSSTPEACLGNEVDGTSLDSSITLKKTDFPVDKLDTTRRIEQRPECLTDTQETSTGVPCKGIGISGETEVSADACNLPSAHSLNEDLETSGRMKSICEIVVNDKTTVDEALKGNVAANSKALDSESSCACSTEEVPVDPMNIDQQTVRVGETGLAGVDNVAGSETANGQNNNETLKGEADGEGDDMLWKQNCIDNAMIDQGENKSHGNFSVIEELTPVEPKREETEVLADNANANEEIFPDMNPEGPNKAASESRKSSPPERVEVAVADHEVASADTHSSLPPTVNEDYVLEEAKIIEAKRKRIAELSIGTVAFEERHRSHWEFVLEEMAWLANDFAQERLWKSQAASQLCRRAASAVSCLRLKRQNMEINHKKVAFSLAKGVMQFWGSMENNLNVVEDSLSSDKKVLGGEPTDLGRDVDAEGSSGKGDPDTGQESCDNSVSLQSPKKYPLLQSYAVRFLRQTNSHVPSFQAELPEIVDMTSESNSHQVSWGDHLTEEKLFYTIPSGAMESYRKLIESYMSQHEGTGNIQDPIMRMSEVCDYGYQENAYNEGEGETGTYYLPRAFEDSKSLALSQKKRKVTTRPYELEADSPHGRCAIGKQQTLGKRPTNFVGQIPTKRFRSASRPRIILPSGTATSVSSFLAPSKTDASSGDTSSFQDDQSTVPSALRMQKSGEVDSVGNYGSSLSHDMAETSMKTKKKRKKYQGSQFEQGWQMDSPILAEQWDQSKRRLENHHFESNGTSGLYDQLVIKKPKVVKHSADNSLDNFVTGSIPSTMASQSVSNPKKILKIFNGHDGGRKTKTLKSPSVQPGSGSSWSQFEDQALVVLVHDMGPNWELVSDAINSILQLKCVYRKPAECKERHKVLMDKTANDGADSTEDSGSSQPYPSTLPGIPKGSARQLFQRLQGPVEEDVMRVHFNKIIQIGQKQRYNKMQSESHDVKQMAVHNSHFAALSQVCPNNLNGVILTPLDLCEEDSTNADNLLPLGYQGSHGNSLAAANQVSAASALPNSGTYPSLPGSGGPVCSPNLLPTSAPHNAPSRDGRYNVQRPSAPPSDEQHRGQQRDHSLSNRNSQNSKLSVSGNDRGVRAFPNGNNVGIPTATNRSMPSSKPAFQGLAGTPAMNPSSMLSSGLVGVPNSGNLHMGSNPSQATPFMRPREALHSARPGNMDHRRQMMAPDLQMQVAQGNSHGIPVVNGVTSGFSNQATSPVSTFPAHSQSQHQIPPEQSPARNRHQNTQLQGTNHSTGPQSQAYAIRLAKERQLQKRYMQQQQLPSAGSLMSHVQPPPQKPLSSALPSSTQAPLQSPSQPVPSAPLTPSSPINPMIPTHVPKVPMQASGLVRNAQSGVGSEVGKQRQRQLQPHQQFQQSGRQHPQQRLLTQAPAKVPKGGGRGNAMTNQNLQNESSKINGISLALGSSAGEKDVMRGQGLINMHPAQQSKPLASQLNNPQGSPQTSSDMTPPLKQFHQQHQPLSQSDGSSQGQILPVPSGQNMHHSASSIPMASNHLEVQLPQLINKRQLPITQSIGPRMAQNQVAHEPLAESRRDCKGDPSPVCNTLTVGASKGMPLASRDSSDSPPIHWQASEPLYEAGIMSATGQIGRSGNLVYSGAARSDLLSSVNQGLEPRQKLDVPSVQCQGPGLVEEQRQLQSTHSRHSSALTPSSQQPYHAVKKISQLEQLPSKEQSLHFQPHHQTPHLVAGQGNTCPNQANSDVG